VVAGTGAAMGEGNTPKGGIVWITGLADYLRIIKGESFRHQLIKLI